MHITRSMFVSVSASVGLLLARPAGARSDRVIDPKAQAIVERGIEAVRTLDSLELVARSSLAGRVVLLDFWATWCGPCKAAMPLIQKLHDDYRGKPVTVLGVNVGERKPDAGRAYMKEKGFTYGCLLVGEELSNAYGITGIPTLVVIGKDGTVALLEVGLGPDGDRTLRAAIDAALAP